MPVTEILDLRLLPPLAIGRFGSSTEPMDNYEVMPADPPTGYRKLVGARTLTVDRASGEITGEAVPSVVRFRDASSQKRVRPVCPFLEVWAQFEAGGLLEPLTLAHLSDLGLAPSALTWRVRAANVKASRRTGHPGDKITADTDTFTDHAVRVLDGGAAHFKTGKIIRFGDVQYIKPTSGFPELRLRFTPAAGKVYGPTAGDPNVVDDVYNPATGGWDEHNDLQTGMPSVPPRTIPQEIYARILSGPNEGRSLGYLDDSCDGIVEVSVAVGTRTLTSLARISAGPPDFAPDSFHVRTLADDLEQAVSGPAVVGPVTADEVREIVRRALDTMRLMNTDFWNEAFSDTAYDPTAAAWTNAEERHRTILERLQGLDAPAGSPERLRALSALRRARTLLRDYSLVGNRTQDERQKMPPFMRGSDGEQLALTRRQVSKIEVAIAQFASPPPPSP